MQWGLQFTHDQVIQFASLMAIVLSVFVALAERKKAEPLPGMFPLALCIGALIWVLYWIYFLFRSQPVDLQQLPIGQAYLVMLSMPFIMGIGPSFYSMAKHFLIVDEEPGNQLVHYIPMAVAFIVVSAGVLFLPAKDMLVTSLDFIQVPLSNAGSGPSEHAAGYAAGDPANGSLFIFGGFVRRPLLAVVTLHTSVYVFKVLRAYSQARRKWDLDFSKFVLGSIALHFSIVIAVIIGLFTIRAEYLALAVWLSLTLAFYYLYLTMSRPGFLDKIAGEMAVGKYTNSTLRNVDMEQAKSQLVNLMDEAHLYTMEDLSAASLAHNLGLTYKQLSELINSEFKQNFAQFINSYRIRDAKRILKDDPEKSVLQIALELGYNSKSTFNKQFKRQTGMSPSEFRQHGRS